MIGKIKALFVKYYDILVYLVFGVMTTVVNYLIYLPCYNLLGLSSSVSNVIAWAVAVAFAYVTNKPFVFKSRSWSPGVVKKELASFIGARLLTFALEELGLFVAANLLHLGRYAAFGVDGIMLSKLVLNVLVIIGNYILSKWIIFKK